jgi:peptide-methionine (R)-S-oxide reductase
MTMTSSRRQILLVGAGLGVLAACTPGGNAQAATYLAPDASKAFTNSQFRKLTDADWKQRLPEASYEVLRHEDTETPGTSPLTDEKRAGTFACKGCGLPLFKSDWIFHSGTGWPSFYTAIKGAVETKTDTSLGMTRVEYHCAQCLGHQGHIFEDGPKPTGLRYCNNGVALNFIPKTA